MFSWFFVDFFFKLNVYDAFNLFNKDMNTEIRGLVCIKEKKKQRLSLRRGCFSELCRCMYQKIYFKMYLTSVLGFLPNLELEFIRIYEPVKVIAVLCGFLNNLLFWNSHVRFGCSEYSS